ncbi:MAG: hypothetical protein ACR2QW_03320 [bacterium]
MVELWDTVALAVQPSREVMQSEAMQETSVHRSARLAGQLDIATAGHQKRDC